MVTWIDIITNFILVWNLSKISVVLLFIDVTWMSYIFIKFKKNPDSFKLVNKVEVYTYFQESLMILTIVLSILSTKFDLWWFV